MRLPAAAGQDSVTVQRSGRWMQHGRKKRTGPGFKKASSQPQIAAGAVGCGCHISSGLAPLFQDQNLPN